MTKTKLVFSFFFLFVLFFAGFIPANAQVAKNRVHNYFRLNTHPQNKERMPNPDTEYGVILDKDSPVISIGSSLGTYSEGILPTGALVICTIKNDLFDWVGACGNEKNPRHFATMNWRPEGKKVYFRFPGSYQRQLVEYDIKGLYDRIDKLEVKVDRIENKVDKLGEKVDNLSKPTSQPPTEEKKRKRKKKVATFLVTGDGMPLEGLLLPFCYGQNPKTKHLKKPDR